MSNVYVHFSQISFPARYSVVNFQLVSHSLRFREVIDIRRRNQRFTSFEDCEEPAAEDHYNLEWKEALGALDERHRAVIELFYGQGCRTEEIAKILGIPKSTVQTRLWRGRKKLEGYYAEEYRRCEGTS